MARTEPFAGKRMGAGRGVVIVAATATATTTAASGYEEQHGNGDCLPVPDFIHHDPLPAAGVAGAHRGLPAFILASPHLRRLIHDWQEKMTNI